MSQEQKSKFVPLERIYPSELGSHFVSNIIVQHQLDHFILSFFEIWPPPIVGETEQEKEDLLNKIESIEAVCVARLVVTPSKMHEFVEAITENLKKYEAKHGKKQ